MSTEPLHDCCISSGTPVVYTGDLPDGRQISACYLCRGVWYSTDCPGGRFPEHFLVADGNRMVLDRSRGGGLTALAATMEDGDIDGCLKGAHDE